MNIRRSLVVPLVAATALLAAACTAGDTTVTVAQPQQTGISVSGTGSVTVVPDLAVLSLGVEVTRETVAEAQSAAAEAMEAMRAALGRDGVEERDIATQYFNIFPQYSRPAPCVETRLVPVPAPRPLTATEEATEDARDEATAEGRAPLVAPAVASTPCPPQEPQITGFRVNNQLTVKVRDLDRLSDVLDDAIAAGGDAVRVNNVSFSVDEPEQYLGEAREQAMQDARERAEQLASLAGVTLGQVRSISESSAPPSILRQAGFALAEFAAAPAAATPLSPGEAEVSLTVFVVYEVE
jgi:hypothetical protein